MQEDCKKFREKIKKLNDFNKNMKKSSKDSAQRMFFCESAKQSRNSTIEEFNR